MAPACSCSLPSSPFQTSSKDTIDSVLSSALPSHPSPSQPLSSSPTSIEASSATAPSTSSSSPPPVMATATMTMTAAPFLGGPLTLNIPSSVRQSPPPVSCARSMPSGAVLSPPESASDSDEDGLVIRGRDRQSLKGLKDSMRPTTMEVSPHIIAANPPTASTVTEGPSFVLSHRRTLTEPGASIPRSSENAIDDEHDCEIKRHPMVRKKSGELVRPALRGSSRSRRANSAPGTPQAYKAVHFDSQLEHVRHFAHQDRPAAVSAGTSPNEMYESESEFPFHEDLRSNDTSFTWEMITKNFPALSAYRQSQPICLEKVVLSPDQKSLVGTVSVANLSFQKLVVCRFTFDYWKTTSEVVADYSETLKEKIHPNGTDRFNFAIRLSDTADLENKTMYFCVRYTVDGREFWDNNTHLNFQVDFRKKYQRAASRTSTQTARKAKPMQAFSATPIATTASAPAGSSNGLPRSSRRAGGASSASSGTPPRSHHRSKSMPAGLAADGAKNSAGSPPKQKDKVATSTKINPMSLLEDEPIALRLKPKRTPSPEHHGVATGTGLAFSNRYDFGASLSAARMEPSQKVKPKARVLKKEVPSPVRTASPTIPTARGPIPGITPGLGARSTMQNASYEEIVNKYCFFGSKPTGPIDGPKSSGPTSSSRVPATGYQFSSSNASASTHSAPAHHVKHAGPAQHHHVSFDGTPGSPITRPMQGLGSQEAALRRQPGYPSQRPQAYPHQMNLVPMSPDDGSRSPLTPGSSGSSSPTIALASPLSPSNMMPGGVHSLQGKSMKEYDFTSGSMHERMLPGATAISG